VAREVSQSGGVEFAGDDVILDVVVAETLAVAVASWTRDCFDLVMMFWMWMCICNGILP